MYALILTRLARLHILGSPLPSIVGRDFIANLRLVALALLLAYFPTIASAAASDCIDASADGTAICTDPIAVPLAGTPPGWADSDNWVYNVCDDMAPQYSREAAWCAAGGGTTDAQGNCTGSKYPPYFDADLFPASLGFVMFLHNPCTVNPGAPSGWGATSSSVQCWGGGSVYQNGIEVRALNTWQITGVSRNSWDGQCAANWQETFYGLRERQLACPAGYSARFKAGGNPGDIECFKKPPPCDCESTGSEPLESVGNPILLGDASKQQREVDVRGAGGLSFNRSFSSAMFNAVAPSGADSALDYWHHSFSKRIIPRVAGGRVMAVAQRETGAVRYFSPAGKELLNLDGAAARLERLTDSGGALTGWRYTTAESDLELYDSAGKLLSISTRAGRTQTLAYSDASTAANIAPRPGLLIAVTDNFGRTLSLSYDANARLAAVADPAGGVYTYAYDTLGNPTRVTYPDQAVRTYLYERADFPHLLTGIVDENGQRFATYTYDSAGLAVGTKHAAGADAYTLSYSDVGWGGRTVTVTDPLGTNSTYSFLLAGGVLKRGNFTRSCTGCPILGNEQSRYDANGNLAYRIDFLGNRTGYTYDLTRNLETQRNEGLDANGYSTAVTRTVSTQWHPVYRLPTAIAEPLRITTYAYDALGNLLSRSIQATTDANGSQGFLATTQGAPRVWTYTYTTYGRVSTAKGPRTDIDDTTTYGYYPDNSSCLGCRGQLQTVTNALGQVTRFDNYDANGRLLQSTDANGVVTALSYNPRGWLTARTVNAGQPGAETTTYAYDAVGQLTRVTQPDGSNLSYTYDAAHRLTDLQDSLGNRIHYTLDAIGNRVREEVYDPQSVLQRSVSRVYDGLNRLAKLIGGADPTHEITQYGYDANGKLIGTTDALGNASAEQYDALSRLSGHTDAAGGQTRYGYNGLGQLSSVTDPRNLSTQYGYNGLGDLGSQVSPDTGTTTTTYDSAGNLASRRDARNQLTNYSYDALNRLSVMQVGNGPTIRYSYDQGANGLGRLSAVDDGSSVTQWRYDAYGRVSGKTQSLHNQSLTVSYGYAPGGKLARIVYPSGHVLSYEYDAAGRVSAVKLDGTPLLTGIAYQAFGAPKAWQWGSTSTSYQREYDLDGRVIALSLPPENPDQQSFSYDALGRLTDATLSATALTLGYQYDGNGNRSVERRNGQVNDYRTASGSNRLSAVSGFAPRTLAYNANGSVVSDGGMSYTYDGRERRVAANATQYVINALGQRLEKAGAGALGASGVQQFVYDEAGHLVGEYDGGSGAALAEHFYLGDWPIGVLSNNSLYYVHPDALGAPRTLTLATTQQAVWWWSHEPFGAEAPVTVPGLSYNLRFPGQYYDAETGTNYNYFRDYDPTTGRYVESDPIGLRGGVNTYSYVHGNPVKLIDPMGLCTCPGGMWDEITSTNWSLSVFFGGGVILGRVEYRCRAKPSVTARMSTFCVGAGPIANLGLSIDLTPFGTVYGNNNCSDFNGWGWSLYGTFGPASILGGLGGGGSFALGASLGLGVALVNCRGFSLTCKCPSCP